MSFYQQASGDAKGLANRLLGPEYNYAKQIKSTGELGMSDKGDIPTLEKDVRGLVGYIKVLVEGGGPASKVNGPLGNKFFLKTGAVCKDVATKKEVPRYIYINNVPKPPLNGLIKGTTTGIDSLNPFRIMGAFTSSKAPDCKKVTLEVIDNNNRKSRETNYVTLADIKYSGLERFTTMGDDDNEQRQMEEPDMPDDIPTQLYFACLAGLSIYVFYRLMKK